MSQTPKLPNKLLWVDLEMTGLDPINDVILEIAAVVTDFNFKQLDSYEAIVFQPKENLVNINEWSLNQHTKSGLLAKIETGTPEPEVISELSKFIATNFADETITLAGNSIHFDRRFISQHWPDVDKLLHYRMLDVSSLKIIMQSKYGVIFDTKKESHRAQDDINESIAELQFYLDWFNKNGS